MLRPASTANRASRRAGSSSTRQLIPASPQPSTPVAVANRTSRRGVGWAVSLRGMATKYSSRSLIFIMVSATVWARRNAIVPGGSNASRPTRRTAPEAGWHTPPPASPAHGAGGDRHRFLAGEPAPVNLSRPVDQMGRHATRAGQFDQPPTVGVFRLPTTKTTSDSAASSRTASCRFCVA